MNKSLKTLALIVTVAIGMTAMAGCKKTTTAPVAPANPLVSATTRTELKLDAKKYAGKTLKIWTWWDQSDVDKADIKSFEEMTGAKVEWTNIAWADYPGKLLAAVAGGVGPDIVFFGAEAVPSYIIKNIILPVSDNTELKSAAFKDLSKAATKFFTYKDKLYGLIDNSPGTDKLFYRKDIIDNNGLEDPYELYKAGKWTWDKFIEEAQALTQDTNGDGKNDVYGYASWAQNQWLATNGATYVSYDESGKPKFALDDPKAIQSLQMIRDITNKYKITAPYDPNNDPQAQFVKGTTAFDYWGAWELANMRTKLGDKLGMVPFPTGPNMTPGSTADDVAITAEGIAASSADPKLAGLWLQFKRLPIDEADAKAKKQKAIDDNLKNYGSQEMLDLNYKMFDSAFLDPSPGFGKLSDIITKIKNANNMTVAQAVEANKQAAQAEIDKTMAASTSTTK